MACKQNKTKIFLASLNQLPVSTYEYKQNNKKNPPSQALWETVISSVYSLPLLSSRGLRQVTLLLNGSLYSQ